MTENNILKIEFGSANLKIKISIVDRTFQIFKAMLH